MKNGDQPVNGHIGVIDIGSNTIRLVVYDTPTRLPFPLFNEKAQCELGSGIAESGRLNPAGKELARQSLTRFIQLAGSMGVDRLEIVATAAIRDAADGQEFVKEIEGRFGFPVNTLSGEEEAQLAALGLLSGVPTADGVLGDLGGGSLDLVVLDKGRFGVSQTLALGHLRIAEESGGKKKKASSIITSRLASVDWLESIAGRTLYAVGGSWRAIARVLIHQTSYPLHVIDGYALPSDEALWQLRMIISQSPLKLEVEGLSRKRLETLPYAAIVLRNLIEVTRPNDVKFSAFGMREGRMLQCLPKEMRGQDPLISGCEALAERGGRFAARDEELLKWMRPLLNDLTEQDRRLAHAACLLSDISWSEHPDYRAQPAFYRALRVPFAGVTHKDRVWIDLAIFVHYTGNPGSDFVSNVRGLLNGERAYNATIIGLALRLAHTISGSAPGLLSHTSLRVEGSKLRLEMPQEEGLFHSESVKRRLEHLALTVGLKGSLDIDLE